MNDHLPVRRPGADRSLALEQVWTRDWPRSLARHCAPRSGAQPNPRGEAGRTSAFTSVARIRMFASVSLQLSPG